MNFPIAERELRVLARTPKTYFSRIGVGFIFFVANAWLLWIVNKMYSGVGTVAGMAFGWIAHGAMIGMVFNANTTADAISSEKRIGTLGLLFLTDLKGFDVVLGKLAAYGIQSLFNLMGIFPIVALTVLLGGISGESLIRTCLTLLNALFFSLSVGLWISTRCVQQKKAANAAVGIALLFLWGFPSLGFYLFHKFGWAEAQRFLNLLSPSYQIEHAVPLGIGMITDQFWLSCGITHALGWVALWRASITLPRRWQDRPEVEKKGRWANFQRAINYGNPAARLQLRRRLLAINPVLWLSSRQVSTPYSSWIFIGVVLAGWVGLWATIWLLAGEGPPLWGVGILATFVLYLGFRLRTCALASEVIARDRLSGALELLLSSSLTERDFANGIWQTFRRAVFWPAAAGVGIGMLDLALMFYDRLTSFGQSPFEMEPVVFFIGVALLFASDLVASVWTGMWAGCITKTSNGAAGLALLRLLVLPWFTMFALMTILGVFDISLPQPEFYFVFGLWWSICFVNNLIWTARSKRLFFERLRLAAAERYQPPKPRKWWHFLLTERPVQ